MSFRLRDLKAETMADDAAPCCDHVACSILDTPFVMQDLGFISTARRIAVVFGYTHAQCLHRVGVAGGPWPGICLRVTESRLPYALEFLRRSRPERLVLGECIVPEACPACMAEGLLVPELDVAPVLLVHDSDSLDDARDHLPQRTCHLLGPDPVAAHDAQQHEKEAEEHCAQHAHDQGTWSRDHPAQHTHEHVCYSLRSTEI